MSKFTAEPFGTGLVKVHGIIKQIFVEADAVIRVIEKWEVIFFGKIPEGVKDFFSVANIFLSFDVFRGVNKNQ